MVCELTKKIFNKLNEGGFLNKSLHGSEVIKDCIDKTLLGELTNISSLEDVDEMFKGSKYRNVDKLTEYEFTPEQIKEAEDFAKKVVKEIGYEVYNKDTKQTSGFIQELTV